MAQASGSVWRNPEISEAQRQVKTRREHASVAESPQFARNVSEEWILPCLSAGKLAILQQPKGPAFRGRMTSTGVKR